MYTRYDGTFIMRILHIIEPLRSGILTALEILVEHTPQIQHSIAYDVARSEDSAYLQKLFPTATLIPISLARTPSAGKYFSSFTTLVSLLKNSSFDLVHCHSSMAGVWGRLAAFYCGVPTFYTPHSFAFLRTDINAVRKTAFWMAEFLLCSLTRTILACGQEEYENAQKLLMGKSRAKLLKNSLDLTPLSSLQEESHLNAHLRVGTSGRLSPQKGPELFSALSKALQQNMEWLWIGASEESVMLPPYVQRTGWISREDGLQLIANLDIYVQTSRWEGLSYALLEAMALGKAVVVADIPSNADVIQHGITGFICATEKEYIDTLTTLQRDPNLRERVGKAAQRYVYEQHNASINYAKLMHLYTQAIGRTGAV